ncbi:alpha/beta fold hydrolase [Hymenobacter wooponensis]|uniref:Alpha/beta hydrolase n=1 Tax=Hymenobacter wooponensis TaxID=1525360 RepID=A0A4Z0MJW4_9BACT|nr:alpha/beta hydrolase [Hymenobacter wooponensis]TGD79640.1 alpha/beta hydrolase [Hymenobacter wooponensis]
MNVLKRNNVTISGAGKQAMVFVHGFGCDQRMWRLVTPAFQESHQVVLLDLVGAGQSDLQAYDPERYNSLAAHADDILAVLRELGLYGAIFVGHSVGCIIGVLAAIKEPARFEKLVLVAPSPRYINDDKYTGGFEPADIEELLEAMDNNYLGWSGSITPVIMGNPDRPELTDELNQSFCSSDPTIARHFARVTFLSDNRADLPHLHTPTLILQCAQDIIAPLAVGYYMHQQIPNSELLVLDESGHCPHLSAPQATIGAIYHFLGLVPTPAV